MACPMVNGTKALADQEYIIISFKNYFFSIVVFSLIDLHISALYTIEYTIKDKYFSP